MIIGKLLIRLKSNTKKKKINFWKKRNNS